MPFMEGTGDDRFRLRVPAGVQVLDDAIELNRGKVFVKVVVHLHSRSTGAGADAFHFFERKHAVAGRFLMANFQALLRALEKSVAALKHARHIGANLHVVLAHGLAVQHRVVLQSLFNLHVVEPQPAPDLLDHLVAHAAVFILRVHHHGDQRAALGRIAVLEQFELRRKLGREFHAYLSTSPRTISIVPMQAMTSALSCPSISFGSACRLIYDGERKWARRGLGGPSLAIKHPSSPRGDSMVTNASPGAGEKPSVKILK